MQAITKTDAAVTDRSVTIVGPEAAHAAVEGRGQKVRAMLKASLGDDVYSSWFKSMEFESFDGRLVRVSVPVKFVRNWIHEHYSDNLLHCARAEFAGAERVEVIQRQPGAAVARAPDQRPADTSATPGHSTQPAQDAMQRSVTMRAGLSGAAVQPSGIAYFGFSLESLTGPTEPTKSSKALTSKSITALGPTNFTKKAYLSSMGSTAPSSR